MLAQFVGKGLEVSRVVGRNNNIVHRESILSARVGGLWPTILRLGNVGNRVDKSPKLLHCGWRQPQ